MRITKCSPKGDAMPRNRYTREVRIGDLITLEIQREQIRYLSRALKTEAHNPPLVPQARPVDEIRSLRRAHARKHKPPRFRNAGTQSF